MRLWLGALIALTVLRLVLAATLPLAPDEAYYFLWSQDLQPGYLDHPSMVALLIRAGVFCFGDTPLGIRFFGPLLAAAGSVLLWDAGERLFPHRHAGVMAAALLNATLMVGVGSIIMTPDTPLLFFWTAGLAAFVRLITSYNPRWWLVIGVVMGLALYSKYTALLFIAAAFIWLVTSTEGRAALRTPWPWVAVVLALLVFAPNIAWNAAHGWASYFKQGGRVDGFDAARSLQFLSELVFGQIGLFTPIIFGLAVLGLWRLGDARTPAGHFLVWLTIVPGVVFLEHVLTGRVQPNWAAILYPSACLAAASLPMAVLRRWLGPGLGLGFFLGAVVYVQAVAAPFPLPAKRDPTALQFAGWQGLAVASAAQKPAFLTSDDYATTAALAYYAPKSVPVAGFESRWKYFTLPSAGLKGETGIMVTRRLDAHCPDQVGTLLRKRGNEVIGTYRMCAFIAPSSGALLARP
jgi:4-amino-4-deoxy-L-arabinose transferase-like glycosyltransferase